MKELSSNSIGQTSVALEFELLQTIDLIDHFTILRETSLSAVSRIMKEIDAPLLSVPGIGIKLGAAILAEIRSIDNFKTPAQLLAFAGSEPSVNTSRGKTRQKMVAW